MTTQVEQVINLLSAAHIAISDTKLTDSHDSVVACSNLAAGDIEKALELLEDTQKPEVIEPTIPCKFKVGDIIIRTYDNNGLTYKVTALKGQGFKRWWVYYKPYNHQEYLPMGCMDDQDHLDFAGKAK